MGFTVSDPQPKRAEDYFFSMGISEDVRRLCIENHYSHRVLAQYAYVGKLHTVELGGEMLGDLVAGVFFKSPSSTWEKQTLELSRLVRANGCSPPLTRLISLTVKKIKKDKKYSLLISYADSDQSHHGGIYQACSWNYTGARQVNKLVGYNVNGVYVPTRTMWAKYKSLNKLVLSKILDTEIEEVFGSAKHLYWKPLDKLGNEIAERANLKKLPYPKPDPSLSEKTDFYREKRREKQSNPISPR